MALFPHVVLSYLSAHFPADYMGGLFQAGRPARNQEGEKAVH